MSTGFKSLLRKTSTLLLYLACHSEETVFGHSSHGCIVKIDLHGTILSVATKKERCNFTPSPHPPLCRVDTT